MPGEQNYQQKKTYKYEYKSNYNVQNSRRNARDISSVGKNGNQRYRSVEQQSSYRRRDQTSESPYNRRGAPINLGRGANFNMRKWAYPSKREIDKIILYRDGGDIY